MRDIRNDLQERAGLIGEQIRAAQAQFEKFVEQLRGEHKTRLSDLRSELEAVNTLMGIEHRRHGAPAAPNAQAQPQAQQPQQPVSNEGFVRGAVREMIGLRRTG
jgi:hypothetical protein